jgi:CheY-like chemotaxis protein
MPPVSIDGDGNRSSVRVLVVDDYEPFRNLVCSMLGRSVVFQVVGQASDGPEAVHKAAELQPDLIVLDIGLPTLNGLNAARQFFKNLPSMCAG